MSEWYRTTIGALTANHDNLRRPVKASDRQRGQYPYYGASGVIDWVDGYTHDGEILLVAEDGENLRSRNLPIAFMARGKSWVNNHAHVVTGNEQSATRFLEYLLNLTDVTGYLTGSAQPKLSRSALDSISVAVPGREEQRAIAEALGALDDKISANVRLQDVTRDLLSARFVGLSIDVEPKEEHVAVSVDDLVELNPSVPKPQSPSSVYLEMKNVPEQQMTVSAWGYREPKGGARFENGDTVLARITPCLENGKTGYVDFLDAEQVGVGSTEFIVMRARQGVPDALPYFLAKSPRFREHAIRNMVGTSGRQRLAAKDLAPLPLCAPDEARLAQFGVISSSLMGRVKGAVDESNALAATRDALLPLLMSGKVTVKDAEKVVEEAV